MEFEFYLNLAIKSKCKQLHVWTLQESKIKLRLQQKITYVYKANQAFPELQGFGVSLDNFYILQVKVRDLTEKKVTIFKTK